MEGQIEVSLRSLLGPASLWWGPACLVRTVGLSAIADQNLRSHALYDDKVEPPVTPIPGPAPARP